MSDELRDALGLILAYAVHDQEMVARTIATFDEKELCGTIAQLLGLMQLRDTVGTDQPDLAHWAAWLLAKTPREV